MSARWGGGASFHGRPQIFGKYFYLSMEYSELDFLRMFVMSSFLAASRWCFLLLALTRWSFSALSLVLHLFVRFVGGRYCVFFHCWFFFFLFSWLIVQMSSRLAPSMAPKDCQEIVSFPFFQFFFLYGLVFWYFQDEFPYGSVVLYLFFFFHILLLSIRLGS